MSILRSTLAVLLTALFVLTAAPAMAQDEDASPFPDLFELEGLEAGVTRGYALDFSQFEAVETDSDEAEYRDVFIYSGIVLEFDSDDNAAAGYDAFLDHGIEPTVTGFGLEDPAITEGGVEDLGEQAFAYSVFNDTGSTEGYIRYVFTQQDAYVFVAIIVTETEESSLDADALLALFVERTEEGHSGVGTHDAEGGSTDGLWAFYPDADHELWAGLIPAGDEVVFPVTDNGV
ncbi:hypothetical protein BH24CHL3_BH24CHL3_05310 [soil metagenome]